MKQLFQRITYINYNNSGFVDFINSKIVYEEKEKCENKILNFDNYQDLYNFYVSNNNDFDTNYEIRKYLFKNKTYIATGLTSNCLNREYIEEKDFKNCKIKFEYIPYTTTIKYLANTLDADIFLEYLKDKGIEKIII